MTLYEKWLSDIEIMDKNLEVVKKASNIKPKPKPKQGLIRRFLKK